MNSEKFNKWVACWGNATSIIDQKECTYSKNLTLRYPIYMCFSGCAIRLHFSNLTGTEPITLSSVFVADTTSGKGIDEASSVAVTFSGESSVTIKPGAEIVSDEIKFNVKAKSYISVSIWLENYTQMNSGVLITGPLSKGYYSYGNFAKNAELPLDYTRNTNWFYFLNTVDVLTAKENRAVICYGDSITAQSWPDYLTLLLSKNDNNTTSIIRRAVSGTRILRQYDCITYAAYGLKGETRFPIEMNVASADTVLIQHGINDIIHPVGTDVNIFRPMSDMPTLDDLTSGVEQIYLDHAKKLNLKTYLCTLTPIFGWRTYADFRENLRVDFNNWMKNCSKADGYIDFDAAVRDDEDARKFKDGCDSKDHLHPSEKAYELMARAVFDKLFKQ